MEYLSDGVKLFCSVHGGDGPAVVLLHPMPCDHRFWLEAAEALTGKYRVIIPDLRGQGRSEAGEGSITMKHLATDIVHLLNELEVQRATFAGCSIGGYAMYELWRSFPERIQALAFCCARPQQDTEAGRAAREDWIIKVRERGTADLVTSLLSRLIGPTAQRRQPERIPEVRSMMQTVTPSAMIALMQGLAMRPDSVETARSIRVPALVLAGGEDPVSTPADMKLLAETIRNGGYSAEYTELRDAGHFAPWEQPEMVGRLLRRFFDSVVG